MLDALEHRLGAGPRSCATVSTVDDLEPSLRLVIVGRAESGLLDRETAPREVTVNAVAPGWVDTEMVAEVLDAEGRDRIASAIPIGRVATARDIAGPIVFLCSDLARHVTGEILNVNGGSVLCG